MLTAHDKDTARQRLKLALAAIIDGKRISDRVPVFDADGRDTTVFGALNYAVGHLNEPFDAVELELVDRACAKLGIECAIDRKSIIATEVVKALIAQR